MLHTSNKFLKGAGLGFLIKEQGKTKRPRSRTLKTYRNKIQKLKTTYSRLKNKSKKFAGKFSTFDSYAKGYNLKEVTR